MRTNAQAVRHRSGFSLIELLIVVVMAGVMMAIVVPNMRVTALTEVQLASMQLAQDIDLARTRALSTRHRVRVLFTVSISPRYAGFLDADGDSTFAESTAEMTALHGFAERTLPVRVVFGLGTAGVVPNTSGSAPVTFNNSRVEFDTRGLPIPMGSDGVVYLRHEQDANAVSAVSVSPSGAVRIWTWRSGSWH